MYLYYCSNVSFLCSPTDFSVGFLADTAALQREGLRYKCLAYMRHFDLNLTTD